MKKRIFGLDLIRVIAVIMVIGVHSLSKNGYYEMPLSASQGPMLFVITMIRWLFYTCVPLFIIITGYVKKDKKIDKNHYKSIIHILVDYLIICIIFILYHQLYLKVNMMSFETIIKIINFNLMPYSWYLQLYIGLFLIIPFLNIMYNNMPDKKTKEILILTVILLCGLSTTINPLFKDLFDVNSDLIFSSYLPVTYSVGLYLIGAYIKEYQPKINKIKNIFYIIIVLLIQAIVTYFYCRGEKFSWSIMGGYGNIFTVVLATLIFCLCYNFKINKKYEKIPKIMSYLSDASFNIYLISYIVDQHFYKYFQYLYIPWYMIILLMPLHIILHFCICTLLVSIIKIFKKILNKISRGKINL